MIDDIEAVRRERFRELMRWLDARGAKHLSTTVLAPCDTLQIFHFAGESLFVRETRGTQGWSCEFLAPLHQAVNWDQIQAALQRMLDEHQEYLAEYGD